MVHPKRGAVEEECEENADAGVIPLDDDWPNGAYPHIGWKRCARSDLILSCGKSCSPKSRRSFGFFVQCLAFSCNGVFFAQSWQRESTDPSRHSITGVSGP